MAAFTDQILTIFMGLPDIRIFGGPPGHLPYLVSGLRERGCIVVTDTYGNSRPSPSLLGRILTVLKNARGILRALGKQRVDIIHLNSSFDYNALLRDVTTLAVIRLFFDQPLFFKFHGTDARLVKTHNPILHLLTVILFKMCNGIGVLSLEEKANFARAGYPPGQIHVVKNIVRTDRYIKDPMFRKTHNIPSGVPILLFISRFIPAKGLMEVVGAIERLKGASVPCCCVCVGEGPDRAAAERYIGCHDLSTSIRLVGYVSEEEAQGYYANSDVLIFPSYHQEGFPMAVFQSLAAGLPIVTTRIRASADYLREPENCLWIPPRDVPALAYAVKTLLDNPSMMTTMALNNRILAQQFSQHLIAAEFDDLYRTILCSSSCSSCVSRS
jgi:glycosyltransferase involved in cell wall biosynthesis